ncbi:hypothetical protein FRC10_002521 [Ceratobasidium sp. 414]|nr:hypothetical protein FRC10_002521 [Ceratobasidium sp. 414]
MSEKCKYRVKFLTIPTDRRVLALKATYKTTKWEETSIPSVNEEPVKIIRVRTEREFKGAIVGKGACHFRGSIGGSEEGEVIFWTTKGSFASILEAEWTIDEKTARGGLKGLKGHGGYKHEMEGCFPETEVWLNYTL